MPATVPQPSERVAGATSRTVARALADLRRRLEDQLGPRLLRMTLFGSHARGTARADSDVDVLVVVEGLTPADRRTVYEIGADVYLDSLVHVAPLALSPEELAELDRLERLIVQDIARDGIEV